MACSKDDRLSHLPDEILIIILSFLPTKSAISTSVLSRSWPYLWTHITSLRFSIDVESMPHFYAVLFHALTRVSCREIRALELNIGPLRTPVKPYTFEEYASISRNVCFGSSLKEIKVTSENLIPVPPSIFEKTSIEVLEVDGLSLPSLPFKYKVPNLRKLVVNLRYSDLESFENLLESCPLLEFLWVRVELSEKFKYKTIEMKSQKLKWLSINYVTSTEQFPPEKNKIVLDLPNLEYLWIDNPSIMKFCFPDTPSKLVKANMLIRHTDNPASKVGLITAIINPISRVRTLKLSSDLVIGMSFIEETDVDIFHNLTNLEMRSSCNPSWIIGVEKFLQRCPNLERLVLRRARLDDTNLPDLLSTRCFATTLRRIELINYDGTECRIIESQCRQSVKDR